MQKLGKAKAKKKNVQTGIIMGQNTNVFSQLSATFLQNKSNTTEEEERFLKNTQVVQYHDQNINRLISLLRKKAEVTKIKAVSELREEISKMEPEQVEEFISTFAHLYSEIILNEPSKQIVDEFIVIATDLLTRHKKIAITQISTLYPPLLISQKMSKFVPLLFTGTEEEMVRKSIVLLLKKDVAKKFMVMVSLIMDCTALQKMVQPQFQRNCQALTKIIRQLIRLFQKNQKLQQMEQDFSRFILEICNSMGEGCIKEYFKIGGRAKASILELYATFVSVEARLPHWNFNWEPYAKTIGQCFLDKDSIVQQALWKGANHLWLEALLQLDFKMKKEGNEKNRILDIYLPKSQEKLLQVLGLGGFALYKELHRFCEIFPWTCFDHDDTHKQIINKLAFFRKLIGGLLGQQDENEARMQCIASLMSLLLGRAKGIVMPGDQKKAKQIQSLVAKFERQCFENLQERYYTEPPTSKNSFSFYIPQHFKNLLNTIQPVFEFKFHPELSYSLYQGLTPSLYSQKIIDLIFGHSEKSQTLTLRFLEVFPTRKVTVDMSEANPQVENAAKIFLLTSPIPKEGETWINQEWDIQKQLIVFDPRITFRDLEAEDQEQNQHLYSLYFRPTHRVLLPLYDHKQLDSFRFKYFLECLLDAQSSHYVRYLLPFVTDILIPRNVFFANELFSIFAERCKKAEDNSWTVGAHEVLVIRVLSHLLSQAIIREKGISHFDKQNSTICLQSICEFIRLLSAFKMQSQAQDLIRTAQGLLVVEETRPHIFISCKKTLQKAWSLLLKGKLEGSEKIRKNRIKKCLELTGHLLCFNFPHSQQMHFSQQLAREFIACEENWAEGVFRSEPWHIASIIISNLYGEGVQKISQFMLANWDTNLLQIALILSIDFLLPLQALPQIRRQFSLLKNSLQKRIAQLSAENIGALMNNLIRRVIKSEVLALSEGLRSLISFLLIEKEDDSSVLLEILKKPVVINPFQEFIKGVKNINHTLIYNTIVSSIPLKRIQQSQQICADLTSELLKAQEQTFFMILSTTCLLWNKGVGAAEALNNDSVLLKKVLELAFEAYPSAKSSLNRNFAIYSLFSLINVAIGLGGWSIVEKNGKQIQGLFWEKLEHGSELQCLALSVKMRYASRAVLSANQLFLDQLVKELPEVIRVQLDFYSQILRNLEGQEEQLPHHESIISLFIEAAEFLLRAAAFVNQQRMPSEQTLLALVQCPFPALKKSSFLLLKSAYEKKIVKRLLPLEFKDGLRLQMKGDELTGQFCRQALGYFYAWQLLILRRQATERPPESQEQMAVSLQEIIQAEGLSEMFIKNCFFILQDRLDYLKHEGDYFISPDQLLEQDLQNDFLQEGDPEQRMFLLAVRTLFLFICSFPLFLRDFMDKFKKYRSVCQRLLRNVISEAIFKQEVTQIEILEPEWKASGNFEIYVTPNNREIYAEYVHDVIRIGLRLVMRSTYPLMPIAIEFGEGLKMQEGSRWGLMLQSQLHNRNRSIIKGILLWKQNIDKKLSGVEQCAICFDIVNPQGQLPKKACKTCKKKFHGNCIMKWFTKSNKSECPLCKSQFL